MSQPPAGFDQRIVQMIAELSAVRAGEIKMEDRLREDLGLDSVCSMELLSMLAEEFDLDIQLEEAMQVFTVGQSIEMARRNFIAKAS